MRNSEFRERIEKILQRAAEVSGASAEFREVVNDFLKEFMSPYFWGIAGTSAAFFTLGLLLGWFGPDHLTEGYSAIFASALAGVGAASWFVIFKYRRNLDRANLRILGKMYALVVFNPDKLLKKTDKNPNVVKLASVSAQYFSDHFKKSLSSLSICIFIVLILVAMRIFGTLDDEARYAVALVVFYVIINVISVIILSFRIKRGYFGSSESEARDLLRFIVDNEEKFGSGGGHTRIFDPEVQVGRDVVTSGLQVEA